VASTEGLDRDRDTIRASGWKLDGFMRNPVILLGHDHAAPPVARAVDVDVRDGQLMVEIEFPPEGVYPAADMARSLVEQGFLRGASVGFKPLRSKPNDHGGKDYLEAELLEVSLVGIPSNPAALLAAKSRGVTQPGVFKSWLRGERSQSLDTLLNEWGRTRAARATRTLPASFVEALALTLDPPRRSARSALVSGMARVASEAARLGATPAEAAEAVDSFQRAVERERWSLPFPGTGGMVTVGEVEQLAANTAWQHAHSLFNVPSGEPYRPPDWRGV
jgi:HK97 family phage prohead protease